MRRSSKAQFGEDRIRRKVHVGSNPTPFARRGTTSPWADVRALAWESGRASPACIRTACSTRPSLDYARWRRREPSARPGPQLHRYDRPLRPTVGHGRRAPAPRAEHPGRLCHGPQEPAALGRSGVYVAQVPCRLSTGRGPVRTTEHNGRVRAKARPCTRRAGAERYCDIAL